MKRFGKHIVALSLILVTIFSLSFPAFADGQYSSQVVTWWDSWLYGGSKMASGLPVADGLLQLVAGWLSGKNGNVCGKSPDGLHWADYFADETGSDSHGVYRMANCKYCRKSF